MGSSASEKYDLAESDLKSFTRSSIRTKVMLALMDKDMTASELEKAMIIRTSTILHSIKDLMESNLVYKTAQGYALTNVGRMQALMLDDLVATIITLNDYRDFWLSHDMSGIPQELQKKIGMLGKGEILEGDRTAVLKAQEFFISVLKNSKEIYGVSPIIVPGYAEAISIAVENGAKVSLILTKAIIESVIREHEEVLQFLLSCGNFKLYRIDNDIKVAFTVTDEILSFGLFRLDGRYDISSDLNCKGLEARKWGMELFAYYLSKSECMDTVS
jgi:predicted transcriptional regulator